ncbi:hypothetical protein [Ensifer sp. PDNC004]|uniref:hypothetical protein n=1 Tax=Ensifer sp. PDNC004 TaxID=2811423 RepID=UPI001FF03F1E|nr:hypothetical protein [Ensifer sp. PDNC004]
MAILQARLDLLASGPERDRLISDCERISALAEQLLDLQRLEANARPFTSATSSRSAATSPRTSLRLPSTRATICRSSKTRSSR